MTTIIKHRKPAAFYDEFTRKGPGQKNTHYCPGCGHGTAHKLIAEAISDMDLQDRTVFCSPVGCSVFAYYYFDCCNVQCAHGRAPAVATGVRRTLEHAIVISYQGDGDLAGIGTAEILHAANRGENLSVFFINNAIYGMTGGQMAPTTLLGQKTATTPTGRSLSNYGNPIGMAEVIDSLAAPIMVERVSLADARRVMRTRKAIRKAIDNQVQGKGFSFVEILSPCPVGWKMSPVKAREWLIANMEPVFPVKVFRDRSEEIPAGSLPPAPDLTDRQLIDLFGVDRDQDWKITPKPGKIPDQQVKIAGFGGQGVMSAGVLLANCVIAEGLNATWLPSYGPEMRGGTANASVIISQGPIGAPVVDNPNVLIAMNGPSLDAFEHAMQPGGTVIVNSSLISRKLKRDDLNPVYLPATEIASKAGLIQAATVVALGAYALASGVMEISTMEKVIPVSIKRKDLVEVNLKALAAGRDYFQQNQPGPDKPKP